MRMIKRISDDNMRMHTQEGHGLKDIARKAAVSVAAIGAFGGFAASPAVAVSALVRQVPAAVQEAKATNGSCSPSVLRQAKEEVDTLAQNASKNATFNLDTSKPYTVAVSGNNAVVTKNSGALFKAHQSLHTNVTNAMGASINVTSSDSVGGNFWTDTRVLNIANGTVAINGARCNMAGAFTAPNSADLSIGSTVLIFAAIFAPIVGYITFLETGSGPY